MITRQDLDAAVYLPFVSGEEVIQEDVYYLSPNGDDNNSGKTESQAWATFARAWHDLYPGDTLILLDGIYYQSLSPNRRNGEAGNPITIRAKNDGRAVVDGEYKRVPVKIGDSWGGESGENPVGNYFVVEGLVAMNGDNEPDADGRLDCNGAVWCILGDHNTLRRISGYNASPDGNSAVIKVSNSRYNLIEDAVAAGTGRKMVYTHKGEHNIFRRVFAAWGGWDGRLFCQQEWPNGTNLQIYNGDYNIIENGIGFGGAPKWSVSAFVNGSSDSVVGNQVLGTISILAGLDWGGNVIDFGTRPAPCTKTADIDNWLHYRAGFRVANIEGGEAHDNLLQDILSWGNGGEGLAYGRGEGAFAVNHATSKGNYGVARTEGDNPNLGPDSESDFSAITNSFIEGTSYQGEGARLSKRYINGQLTNQPLWPWPMEDRIQRELGFSITDTLMPLALGQADSVPPVSQPNVVPLPFWEETTVALSQPDPPTRAAKLHTADSEDPVEIYVPQVAPGDPFTPGITWFGQVDQTANYTDLRAWHNSDNLLITAHVIDRLLWYDTSPSTADLTDWDAVSLFLDTGGDRYRFDAQLSHWQAREGYQAAYLESGGEWELSSMLFETSTGRRASGLNDEADDRGWNVKFTIPFTSLTGFSGPPSPDAVWRVAVVVHDRDAASGPGPATAWPAGLDETDPGTWARLIFKQPAYAVPPATPDDVVTIRHGLDGVTVEDAHVGGHTVCGEPFHPDYFDGWGDANYVGYSQINIQNQWDIADWPCFSKYYVTFPLDSLNLDADEVILHAALTLHQFGNAWGEDVGPSWIQASTVAQAWTEATLTWNNAPRPVENVSGTWVEPMSETLDWPGVPYQWNVSRAVAEAYDNGEPLRLALYSPDGEYHSGKYFSSSDVDDWNADARPTLRILVGRRCDAPAVTCHFGFLPTLIGK